MLARVNGREDRLQRGERHGSVGVRSANSSSARKRDLYPEGEAVFTHHWTNIGMMTWT